MQALAALLLISNTIQVAAFNRRNETGIMRLVGASRWYTQLPFILEAALAGLVGALLAVGGLVRPSSCSSTRRWPSPIKSGIVPPIDLGDDPGHQPVRRRRRCRRWPAIAAYVTLRLYVRL